MAEVLDKPPALTPLRALRQETQARAAKLDEALANDGYILRRLGQLLDSGAWEIRINAEATSDGGFTGPVINDINDVRARLSMRVSPAPRLHP